KTDGSPDTSFGGGGQASLPGSLFPLALAIDASARIVVAGDVGSDMGVARLNADGSPDTSFGNGGLVTIDFGGNDDAAAVAIDAAGRIVLAGTAQTGSTSNFDFAVARLNGDGSLDTSFNGTGRTNFHFDPVITPTTGATAVALDPAGRIVVAGHAGYGC